MRKILSSKILVGSVFLLCQTLAWQPAQRQFKEAGSDSLLLYRRQRIQNLPTAKNTNIQKKLSTSRYNCFCQEFGAFLGSRCPSFQLRMCTSSDSDAETQDTEGKQNIFTRLFNLKSPILQLMMVLSLYALHLFYFTQHQLVWPVQLTLLAGRGGSSAQFSVPAYRHGVGLGYDSLLGILIGLVFLSKNRTISELPWNLPQWKGDGIDETTGWRENWMYLLHRLTFLTTTSLLVIAYFGTGRLSLFWEDWLYELSAAGWPLTTPRFRAWTVLLGHLSWVGVGTILLTLLPTTPRFFAASRVLTNHRKPAKSPSPLHYFRWGIRKRSWWASVIGGYAVSSWLFNVADWANQYILPPSVLFDSESSSSIVSQLVAPEHNDWVASVVGYLAPCVSAPIWEELLYRGFLLPGLTHLTGSFSVAAVIQSIVFSAHHMSVTAALPLAVLGLTWAILYAWSGNLWCVCLIHALWNSRVFLGSWLGL